MGAACFIDVIFHFLSENRPAERQEMTFCIERALHKNAVFLYGLLSFKNNEEH